ncbi:LacI family DNA-binding transcriptional regulator [Symbioplanes lichenis]|uniref:LacI family DNA-binding transcriptional regulator n=1 Tax=Symbioplanes lichenis TaxID=1629072 RepID=UPI0027395E67|nr:LacI family DNA-binding transcriptional regulator [Actinoplanes lichenis]
MSATLRQVAERAGVSVRTVSNVVSGFALVAPETRSRVQAAIDELRYRPNAAARHLRGGRSGLIALAVPEIASPYFSELAGLLAEEAGRRSLLLSIQQTGGDAKVERTLIDGVPGQTVDAVILSPWALSPAEITHRASDVPVVLLGEQDAGGLFDHVAVDNVAAARETTRHLIERGHRRIAAVGLQPHLGNGTATRRLEGYRQALAEAGLTADPTLEIPVARLHRTDGADAFTALRGRADAAFCFSDQLALGLMSAALRHGLTVPGDLAVAGFDDVEDGRYGNPPLTTVAPDKEAIARAALDCLEDRPAGAPARRVVAGHRLVVRAST